MKFLKLITLLFISLLTACSWNHTAGLNDRFEIISSTELFAPSVTIVHDTKTDVVTPIGGQSVFGQLSGPASAAIGGYLIGEGLSDSGDTVNANNNNPSSSNLTSTQTAVSSSTSKSFSSAKSKSISNNINLNNNVSSGGYKHPGRGHHK